jgi:hypothetical protein
MINDNLPSHEQETVLDIPVPVASLSQTPAPVTENVSEDNKDSSEAHEERKFNGYLRNSNRKNRKNNHQDNTINTNNHNHNQTSSNESHNNDNAGSKPRLHSNPNQKNNKPKNKHTGAGRLKKEPRLSANTHRERQIADNMDNDVENSQPRENVFSAESQLFSFLRQKTGSNPVQFWQLLRDELKEKEFNQIRKSDMSLISYSALYEVSDIFENLLYEYGSQISQEEFETTVLPLCMSKHSTLLKHAIHFYDKHFQPQDSFIDSLIGKACKISYREENNHIALQWLAPHMQQDHYQKFWHECLDNHNVIMLECGLTHPVLQNWLKNNYSDYEQKIGSIGKTHTVLKALDKKLDNNQNMILLNVERHASIPVVAENTENKSSWLGNSEDNFKTLQKENNACKTEITIKRKRIVR